MELLGKGGLLEDVKTSLRYSDWFGTFPFKWNETIQQLEIKNTGKRYILGCLLGVGLLYVVLTVIQNYGGSLNEATLMVITHSILFFFAEILMLSTQFTNCVQLSGFVQLFNGFIQLEQNFSRDFRNESHDFKQKPHKKNLPLRAMVYLLAFTGIMLPCFFDIDILRNPCFPVFVGSWMSSQCEKGKPGYFLDPTWSMEEILTNFLILFAHYSVWAPLLSGCLFQISLENVVEGNCFRVNIEKFEKKLLKTPVGKTQDLMKLKLFYRQIQITSIHYRLNVSEFLGYAIPCLIAMQTACHYNSLAFVAGKDTGGPIWYALAFLWSEVVIMGVTLFVFGILADVHKVSKRVHRNINGRVELKKNRYVKRWIKSCPILRVYFGGSNFMDHITPLNIQDFAINQTVSLMLLNS